MCVLLCNFVSYFCVCDFVLCDILLPSGVINDDDNHNVIRQVSELVPRCRAALVRYRVSAFTIAKRCDVNRTYTSYDVRRRRIWSTSKF